MEVIKSLSDAELVTNLQSGNMMDETIKAFYRHYFESLCWFVMNNSGNRQDAEDIFQEVIVNFIEMVQKGKFRGDSSVKTILFSMNRFTWLNELKRRGRSQERDLNYESNLDRTEADVSDLIVNKEDRSGVLELVDNLGKICKKILLMFYYENLSMKEILDNLDYENEQVVRNKKYKCLKQLEKVIAENPSLKQTLKNLLHG